jgi:hypothetical protein
MKRISKPNFASGIGRLARSKTLIVACLLSSVALLGEPQVAQARNGMNGFVAGALLGGAMSRGFGVPRARVYRGGRTYTRSARRNHRERGTRSRETDTAEKAPPGLGEAGTTPAPVSGAAATAITDTTASHVSATAGAADGAGLGRKPGVRAFGSVKKQLD